GRLESRAFWSTIISLVISSFVLGFVSNHYVEGYYKASPARARGIVRSGNSDYTPGGVCHLIISTDLCGLAGHDIDVHLDGDQTQATRRDLAGDDLRRNTSGSRSSNLNNDGGGSSSSSSS
ncbi:unnamed protein product, partial [Laminaria digitata]